MMSLRAATFSAPSFASHRASRPSLRSRVSDGGARLTFVSKATTGTVGATLQTAETSTSSSSSDEGAASSSSPEAAASGAAGVAGPTPDHAKHREAVLSQLPEGKLVYVPAGKAQTRNGVEGHARFRQEPDFLYLTGVADPGYAALFGTGADAPFVLVAPRQPEEMDVWCGAQATPDELRRSTGADIVYYDDEWEKALDAVDALEGQTIFIPSHGANRLPEEPIFEGLRADSACLARIMAKARSVKSPREVECLRRANDVSGAAHEAMWRAAARKPGIHEFELEAVFAAETMKHGLMHLGYPSIVGAGRNAATLHYERNDKRCVGDDLVLVDAGAEWEGYTADITRTFPASGTFEAKRRATYEAVLSVQNAAIEAMRPGANWRAIGETAKLQTVQALIDLGIVRGDAQDAVMAGVAGLFLPHSLGHLLGLQVHDVGPSGPVPGTLLEGMVVTCEPGIYFIDGLLGPALEDPNLRGFLVRDEIERFREVGGVRIEDNIAVTAGGYDNLTTCPKTVDDIEAIMRG